MPMSHSREEQGAVALLVAILSLALLGVGAVAVDMGQVYAKRAALQSNVDLAVLAAAVELNGTGACTVEAKAEATRFLTLAGNAVALQAPVNLNDGERENGDISCDGWTVKLWAPRARVDFGLAKALAPDNAGVDVPAFAEAAVHSPRGRGVMPAFVASGCDYGEHSLVPDFTPSNSGSVPDLRDDDPDDRDPRPDSMTPTFLRPGTPGGILTISGRALGRVNRVAFTTALRGSNLHVEETPTFVSPQEVRVRLPQEVRDTPGDWFVRVSQDGGQTWTRGRTELRLTIGDLVLHCDTDPAAGDFGSLFMPRKFNLTSADNVAANLALGLDFSVTRFPNPGPAWQCSSGGGGVVSTPGGLNDLTNCVSVDPDIGAGMSADAAERGLLTGGGMRARLARPTTSGCGSSLAIDFGGSIGSRLINNDELDCFIKSGATNSFQSAGYAGGAVIRASIFRSPRFFWVPVLGTSTTGGGQYQIVDFRPAFITGNTGGDEYNGFTLPSRGGQRSLEGVRIVLFNVDALPESVADVSIMDYLGVGTKVISLVD